MNRRQLLAGAGALASAAALAACAGTSAASLPQQVASDIQAIAAGLKGILPQLGTIVNIPAQALANAGTAIADLQAVAAKLAGVTAAQGQSVVQTVEADVNAVVTALAALPLPPPISTVIQAAAVLLPILEAAVGLVVTKASASSLTPAQARLVLRSAAAK